MSKTLGIDASTQSLSALVIDTVAGRVVAEASVNFGRDLPQYDAPQGFIPGGAEGEVHSDPQMWLDALERCLEQLGQATDLSEIAAISGAGQQHGSVYLNERWPRLLGAMAPSQSLAQQLAPALARPTSPIWMDTSTGGQCAEIADAMGGADVVCRHTGSVPVERFTGPQIRRFAQTDPDGYAATAHIHLVSSFVASVLIGKEAPIDHGDGAGMNLLNIDTWEWDRELVAATADRLTDRLPPVVQSGTIIGEIAPFFIDKFSFKAGTPVVAFTGDNPSSLVGMGASTPGKVVISLGTSDTFFAAMPNTTADPDGYGHVFGNPMGGGMTLQCFVNGSLAREHFKNAAGFDWAQFEHEGLGATPPGNDGNLMIPFLRPEISPRVDLPEPVREGQDAFTAGRDPVADIRACVEGQFLNMYHRTRWMGLNPSTIFLTGGASQSDGIAQIVADILKADVERLAVPGSVALGACIRAAAAAINADLAELEAKFCQPVPGSRRLPEPGTREVYDRLENAWANLLHRATH